MGLNHSPSITTSGLILCLDAGNPNSYPGTIFPTQVEYLIVAGGGGGGGGQSGGLRSGGGGGGGGVLTSFVNVTPQSYVIVVGLGGGGGTADNAGSAGQASLAFGLTATGGGGGGSINTGPNTGGSGGGGSGQIETPAIGTTGQGTAGGNGISTTPFAGGGGGGSSTPGQGPVGNGAGGNGISSSISGTATFYAGGGGGGNSVTGGGRAGQGSTGNGGGAGGNIGSAGTAATANTGGGGGGAGGQASTAFAGGAGGSGVVIIRYPGAQQATGGTVATAGGFTTHTFTASGTFGPLIWADTSGNANNGTLGNGPGFNSANGGSLVFNGVNNGATFAGTNLSLNQMTISSWNFATSYAQNGFMFEKTTNGTVNTQYSLFYNSTNEIYFRTQGLSTTDLNINTTSAGVINGQWNNVVATWDGVNKRIYVNGNLAATSATLTGTVVQNTTGAAFLGIYGSFAGYPFLGRISATAIYNRALSQVEISQNFNALRGRFGI